MANAPSTGREAIRTRQLEQLRALLSAVRPAARLRAYPCHEVQLGAKGAPFSL